MRVPAIRIVGVWLLLWVSCSLFAQTPDSLSADQIVDKAYPSVALVLAGRAPGQIANSLGAAVVVHRGGVLLTAYHLVKNAYSLTSSVQDRRSVRSSAVARRRHTA